MCLQFVLAVLLLWPLAGEAGDLVARSPFGITVTATNNAASRPVLRVDFTIPQNCVLNLEHLHFRNPDGSEVQPQPLPEPELEINTTTSKTNKVYLRNFSAFINRADLASPQLLVRFQGCTNDECYFPEQRRFALRADGAYTEIIAGVSESNPQPISTNAIDWINAFKEFKVMGQQTGYLTATEFKSFLDKALAGQIDMDDPLERFHKLGLFGTLLLIIAGGFLLNFTPCILPMIPINLAIIGAGRVAKSRVDGFLNGAIYGIGMALAYGTLGLVVVLTGSKFGTLNSSMWFNLGIAFVFLVMALGMFDVVNIDLSRFSGRNSADTTGRGALAQQAVVFSMGVMSALLAGACVAPVVISVVLLATNLYAKGSVAGLLLPFLLGVGMALPWPLAGAGLTFMPKPGKWMKYVKHGFGLLILIFAVYYLKLAWHVGRSINVTASVFSRTTNSTENDAAILSAIQQAQADGRPLLIDFHASWCKDCSAMDQTVFNQREIMERLLTINFVRYAAEQPNAAPGKALLDHFKIVGLPTYLVLKSKSTERNHLNLNPKYEN